MKHFNKAHVETSSRNILDEHNQQIAYHIEVSPDLARILTSSISLVRIFEVSITVTLNKKSMSNKSVTQRYNSADQSYRSNT